MSRESRDERNMKMARQIAPTIQRLEAYIKTLRRTVDLISVFALDWKSEYGDDIETLLGSCSVISDTANELDEWTAES